MSLLVLAAVMIVAAAALLLFAYLSGTPHGLQPPRPITQSLRDPRRTDT
jgi:hypothetical protein